MKKTLIIIAIITLILTPTSLERITDVERTDELIAEKITEKMEDSTFFEDATFDILYPRCSAPAIVEKGGSFNITVKNCVYENIFIKITTAFETVIDEIYLEYEKYIGTNYLHIIANVPDDAPVELYNLTIIGKEDLI